MTLAHPHLFRAKDARINRTATLFLKTIIFLIGIGTLAFLLWEPHLEGRSANATLFAIYFKDPFLAYVYAASVAFFAALSQALKLVTYIERDNVFSEDAVRALRIIKYCGGALVIFIAGALAYIVIAIRGTDDITGGIMMCLVAMSLSVIITAAAAVFEKLLQRAVEMKTEHDFTV